MLSILDKKQVETRLREAPPELQDSSIKKEEELEELNIGSEEQKRPLFVNKAFGEEERQTLVDLLREFKDIFALSYDEMPGLSPILVIHNLAMRLGAVPVKQAPRKFADEIEAQINKKIEKLLQAKFIKPIQHPTWLANIILVKKKNGHIRCCVDF